MRESPTPSSEEQHETVNESENSLGILLSTDFDDEEEELKPIKKGK